MGSSQNWTIFRDRFYAFKGLFLRPTYRMGDILGIGKFQIFFGVLEKIPDILRWRTVDAGPEPRYEEKVRVTPWGI